MVVILTSSGPAGHLECRLGRRCKGRSQEAGIKYCDFTLKNRQESPLLHLLYKVSVRSWTMRLIVAAGCSRHKLCVGGQKTLSRPWKCALLSGLNNNQDFEGRHVSSEQGCRIDYVFLYRPTAYIIHTVQAITFLLNTQLSLMVDVTHLNVTGKSLHAHQNTLSASFNALWMCRTVTSYSVSIKDK
jgi:hypothetical protein